MIHSLLFLLNDDYFYIQNTKNPMKKINLLSKDIKLSSQKPSLNHTSLYKFSQFSQNDSPLKQCKNVLQILKQPGQNKEDLSLFKSSDLSNHIKRSRSQAKTSINYQRLVTYSLKKKRIEEVSKKRKHIMRKSSEVIATLDKIVHGVMVKELICENGSANNDEIVESLLKDQKEMSDLLQEIVLRDRFLEVKKENQITKRQRKQSNVEYNPQHFRLNQLHRDINIFYRRKFVKKTLALCNQRKIVNFQTTKLQKQQQKSRIVMRKIMTYYSSLSGKGKDQQSQFVYKTMRRLFLHYAKEQSPVEQSFRYILNEKAKQFIKDFEFQISGNKKAQQVLTLKHLDNLSFLQLIYSLNNRQGSQQQNTLALFLKEKIAPKEHLYVPAQCLLYEKNKVNIQNRFKSSRIKTKLQSICIGIMKNKSFKQSGEFWLNFQDLHELMLTIKIYPDYLSKMKLKYYQLYCETPDRLISIENIKEILAYTSFLSEINPQYRLQSFIKSITRVNK